MKNQGAQVNIFSVKGHTGVLGNELADREAKEAAATYTEYFHYNKVTKAQLAINTVSLMKRKWSFESSKYGNSWFKNFIPQVEDDDAGKSVIIAISQVIWFIMGLFCLIFIKLVKQARAAAHAIIVHNKHLHIYCGNVLY